jgi:hypothetical protein
MREKWEKRERKREIREKWEKREKLFSIMRRSCRF